MKNLKIYTLLLVSAVIAFSCDEEDKLITDILVENPLPADEVVTGSSGDDLDLSVYVALGNSLTAGFQDGALYTDGQINSFTGLLAQQFQVEGVGGGSYVFPNINSANGYYLEAGGAVLGKLFLDLDANNDGVLGDAEIVPSAGDNNIGTRATDDEITNLTNFGVPGINITDLDDPNLGNPTSDDFNPYYFRFSSDPVTFTSTVLDDAIARNPTFISLWIGANDYLGYARAGAASGSVTSAADFQTQLTAHLTKLVSSPSSAGAKGVILNLPPVTILPYFRAVPYNAVPLTSQDDVDDLNAATAFGGYNAALDGLAAADPSFSQDDADARKVTYALGANPVLIKDTDLTDLTAALSGINPALALYGQVRQANSTDLMLLPAATVIGTDAEGLPDVPIGIANPLGDEYVLTLSEQGEVGLARGTYNAIIDGVLANPAFANYTVVDLHPFFADAFGLSSGQAEALGLTAAGIDAADGEIGIVYQGYDYQPDFSPNGLFSNDAIHPNPRGHAIVTNVIIETLNDTYGSSIPMVQINQLRSSPFQQ
ncbi:MAG: hypothetical protein ABJF11_04795 [Reichenbachiella sp.]|uniref:hypothetical protein n=1 Tax=Reichenbachiella sp. TaxID=2184521 RepID=UPI00326384BE